MAVYTGPSMESLPEWNSDFDPPVEWVNFRETLDALGVGGSAASSLAAHIADTSAAHAATAIAFTPNGSIAATTVQAAIQEVRDEHGVGKDFVQDTDPALVPANNVAAKDRWWDITEGSERTGVRNAANNDWVFFSDVCVTWAEIEAAVDAAPSTPNAKTLIRIANAEIIQTSALTNTKSIILEGTGPLSCLTHEGNLTAGGTTVAIYISGSTPVSGIEFRNFKIRCNRAVAPSATRTSGFMIAYDASDILFSHVTFKDLTSTGALILGADDAPTLMPHNIRFEKCTFDEWYEQGVEIVHGHDISVVGCTMTSTASHPELGSTDTTGLMIASERTPDAPNGAVRNILFADNTIDLSGLADQNNSFPITLSEGGQTEAVTWQYDKVRVVNNTLIGGANCLRLQAVNTLAIDNSYILIEGNTMSGSLSNPIGVNLPVPGWTDLVRVLNNHLTVPVGVNGGWATEINNFDFYEDNNTVVEL
jgi:hypothetical protein